MITIEKNMTILKNVSEADKLLFEKMPFVKLTSEEVLSSLNQSQSLKTYSVSAPNKEFGFLHEGAVIIFKGKIFAAWYNNEKLELSHRTPIRYSISEDEGQTWSDARIIADDPEGNTLYCPPVFGIEDGRLYLFLNEMVKADHMHALDLYVYDEEVEQFVLLWSRPIPFKLNTNVYTLPSGKRMLCGRTGPLDGFPTIPSVMITDSGKIDAPWRMVKLQEHDELPDGRPYVHPEISATLIEQTLYVFCRNDHSTLPLLFISHDEGETWLPVCTHNIPFSASKIYAGTLNDGRSYVIGNIHSGRERLAIFFTEPNDMAFTKGFILQDGYSENLKFGRRWHYPCAYESDGKLYVVYTAEYDETVSKRGLVISVIDLREV